MAPVEAELGSAQTGRNAVEDPRGTRGLPPRRRLPHRRTKLSGNRALQRGQRSAAWRPVREPAGPASESEVREDFPSSGSRSRSRRSPASRSATRMEAGTRSAQIEPFRMRDAHRRACERATVTAVGIVTRMRRDAVSSAAWSSGNLWPRDRARPAEITKMEGGTAQTSLPCGS